jgi:hypothetical protein
MHQKRSPGAGATARGAGDGIADGRCSTDTPSAPTAASPEGVVWRIVARLLSGDLRAWPSTATIDAIEAIAARPRGALSRADREAIAAAVIESSILLAASILAEDATAAQR